MKLKERLVLTLSSACGLGYAPKAPGTAGTVAAIPIWWAMSGLYVWLFTVITVASIAFAVLISAEAEKIHGGHDNQKIVIDEVVGLMVGVIGVPFAWPQVLAAFVVFRVLDATKPPPIKQIDKHVGGGFGVVIDDVVAGLGTLAIMHGARVALGGWW